MSADLSKLKDDDLPAELKRRMRPSSKSATVHPIRLIDDPTQFAGMSGTAPLPPASPSDLEMAAHEKRPGRTPVQDARDRQDEIYPDEEGPEGGA